MVSVLCWSWDLHVKWLKITSALLTLSGGYLTKPYSTLTTWCKSANWTSAILAYQASPRIEQFLRGTCCAGALRDIIAPQRH
jgi:hypothetical protein